MQSQNQTQTPKNVAEVKDDYNLVDTAQGLKLFNDKMEELRKLAEAYHFHNCIPNPNELNAYQIKWTDAEYNEFMQFFNALNYATTINLTNYCSVEIKNNILAFIQQFSKTIDLLVKDESAEKIIPELATLEQKALLLCVNKNKSQGGFERAATGVCIGLICMALGIPSGALFLLLVGFLYVPSLSVLALAGAILGGLMGLGLGVAIGVSNYDEDNKTPTNPYQQVGTKLKLFDRPKLRPVLAQAPDQHTLQLSPTR